jgi:hypothetical protein
MLRRRGCLTVTQQINELSIVCGSENDMRLHIAAVSDQLDEHRLTYGDPFDGVCATKQFIQQTVASMPTTTGAGTEA